MMASIATGNPLPPFYIGVPYAPTPKKDEALVFQASHTQYNNKNIQHGPVLTLL